MRSALEGRTLAILAADGVEQVELTTPRNALRDAGATVVLLAPSTDDIQAVNGDINPSDTFSPDDAVSEGFVLVTSRKPDDVDAFIAAAIEAFSSS
jgi:protease I